ncbi:unnamed protein product [Microthlaspi erraticum]|uniref:Uncharacterized protein n=1 Tax=Microthlaspi erraticum TaxID=1685480 RepID=A0A6D2IX12_9BRAS|nr:unnamed protein product [Microthlaspi erraticum]
MVTATRQGLIRPSKKRSTKHSDGSASAPVEIDDPVEETTIPNPPPQNSNMQEGAAVVDDNSNKQLVPYEAESDSFTTAEDEEAGGEEATAEKSENRQDEKPSDPHTAGTLDPPPTEGATEAAVTTPPVVTVGDELNATATEIPEPDTSIPPSDLRSAASPSQVDNREDTEALDELNLGEPSRSEQKEPSPDPPNVTVPTSPSPVLDQTRYAVSNEELSEEDISLIPLEEES